jgi:hypothetical protein
MSSKIGNLSELENVLCDIDKTNKGVLHFVSAFKLSRLLGAFNALKSKGISVSVLLVSLIFFRLRGGSINSMVHQRFSFLPMVDDNTFYRLMNNPWMDWRRLLLGFAKQFKMHVETKAESCVNLTCFIVDDTDLPKSGKTIEFVSRIFNHVNNTYHLGYKMLLLGWFDGKSIVPADFSLHREAGRHGNYGLTGKDRKKQFKKQRDKKSLSLKRIKELDENKVVNTISMLKRAGRNGFMADYVLMDSWFVNDYIIKGIRGIKHGAMHVLGLCKIDKRNYHSMGKMMNAKQLIVKHERKKSKHSRQHKSHYIPLVVDYKGEAVKLFFIRYNNANKWTLMLTTDLKLNFTQAIERYQIRWSIEVLFKECKQYLRLGGSQNTDFDGQIADTTLALATYTILTLQKRFGCYETLGGLFREIQQGLLEMTLWERLIRAFIQMVIHLLDFLSIDIEETMRKMLKLSYNDTKFTAVISLLEKCSHKPEKTNNLDIVLV